MGKKRKTLPKDFQELINKGDMTELKEIFNTCEWDARGGYSKITALSFYEIPDELVRWLVEQGANVNARDRYGCTPLHNQASKWQGNVRLLLQLGADIEAIDHSNETPLHAAARAIIPQNIRELVSQGANVLAENDMNQTPLGQALASCRNIDIVRMAEVADILLNAGTPITPTIRGYVTRIGKEFEFVREQFK